MINSQFDILIAGVGGQGTVLASRLLAAAAIKEGYFARTSETIGMSQRGGCVVSHVRVDSENCSSIIPFKTADMIIAFELAEAARSLPRLKKDGSCIINTQVIKPVSASLGTSKYNVDEIDEYIKNNMKNVYFIDGYSIARDLGTVKAINVVLLGAATAIGKMPFSKELMLESIVENVPQKFRDLNKMAFERGYESILIELNK